ncbi:MAG: MIP family channel protein [Campylobacterota bacterium]|nr:MIP family channel protein [Campylobacterota bacterium]
MIKRNYVVEFIATFIMVFAGCGAIVIETLTGALGHAGVALTWGFVVIALIYTFGHISGAHMNPAVTISFTVMKEFDKKDTLPYIIAQVLGATLAALILYLLFLEEAKSVKELAYLGLTLPRGSNLQLFIMEFILTFILMLVICGSAVHGKAIKSFAGLAIGLTVGLEAMFAGPITMASMNPARTLGPAIISGNFETVWLYIVATILGALFGGFVFVKYIKCKNQNECSSIL